LALETVRPAANTSERSGLTTATWATTAAFGTYFCMFAFRKPFTAATYEEITALGISLKTLLVTSQVLGYMTSKFIGIKVIAEMQPHRRAASIFGLICAAELALVLFGFVPMPWNSACLFLNGLALGMVFGLVLGFLEGRTRTEAMTAGLCVSFILADGVAKSLGSWLLQSGVSETWMPATAGLFCLLPLGVFIVMLSRIPAPSAIDTAARSHRTTMNAAARRSFIVRYAFGLSMLVMMYLFVSILRSLRGDFAPELWLGLGYDAVPSTFTTSELFVALGVLLVNGSTVVIRNNRTAFFSALAICLSGLVLLALAMIGHSAGRLGPFWFMVTVGLALYLPYVAVHTTVFERMLAMTRERANLGFLMCVADAIGYLGYVAVMTTRRLWTVQGNFADFYIVAAWICGAAATAGLLLSWRYFARSQATIAVDP
jgi:Family of unknown function (DUF5690)